MLLTKKQTDKQTNKQKVSNVLPRPTDTVSVSNDVEDKMYNDFVIIDGY